MHSLGLWLERILEIPTLRNMVRREGQAFYHQHQICYEEEAAGGDDNAVDDDEDAVDDDEDALGCDEDARNKEVRSQATN
jgi:hypothetical protein